MGDAGYMFWWRRVADRLLRFLLSGGPGGDAGDREVPDEAGGGEGFRRYVPSFSTPALAAVLLAFILGGLAVAIDDELGAGSGSSHASAQVTAG